GPSTRWRPPAAGSGAGAPVDDLAFQDIAVSDPVRVGGLDAYPAWPEHLTRLIGGHPPLRARLDPAPHDLTHRREEQQCAGEPGHQTRNREQRGAGEADHAVGEVRPGWAAGEG